ncbi:MAG: hypothetical protein WCF22_24825 [Candidatus Sulfotelmatobacter sp.]
MIDTSLVAEKTVVSGKGDGASIDLSGGNSRVFLVALEITRIIEQESLEISIIGSADGTAWEPKPVVTFPQKFYCGQYPLLLDLSQHTNVRFIRAHWEVSRWGRGTETPMFEFGLKLKEVPSDFLNEMHALPAESKMLG